MQVLNQLDQGQSPALIDHVLRISETTELYCLPAGRASAEYARQLRLMDPEIWYREESNPLRHLLSLAAELPFKPDFVLLDARTGLSPISAPLLFDASDVAVVAFYPHPQARIGTQALVQAILSTTSTRRTELPELTPELRFVVSPLPPTVGPDTDRLRLRALDWIREWTADVSEPRAEFGGAFEPDEITHFVRYNEAVASLDTVGEGSKLSYPYEPVADWLDRFVPTRSEIRQAPSVEAAKPAALNQLAFTTGTAESQPHFLDSFVRTEVFARGLDPDFPVVLGRKGTGKTAIFRLLSESDSENAVVVLSPDAFRRRYPWVLGPAGFSTLGTAIAVLDRAGWRDFWTLYAGLACFTNLLRTGSSPDPPSEFQPILEKLSVADLRERAVVEAIRDLLAVPDAPLIAWDWLQDLDEAYPTPTALLLDGLDTGFGNAAEDRARRDDALAGLFSMVLERQP